MIATHRILPGWGYWDATRYPIGGSFHRAPHDGDGIPVVSQGLPQLVRGYGYLMKFKDSKGRILWADERAFEALEV